MQESEPLFADDATAAHQNDPTEPSPEPAEAFQALQRAFWHVIEHAQARADFARFSVHKAFRGFLADLAKFFVFASCLIFSVCLVLYGLGSSAEALFPGVTGLGFVIVGLSFTAVTLVFLKFRAMRGRKKALEERLDHERQRINRWKSRWNKGDSAVPLH